MSDTEAPDIAVETTETSPIQRTLRVEVEAKRVRKAFDHAYRDLAKQARVRGFRPGKAPRSVLEKMYGSSVAEDLEERLVQETLPQAIEQSGVEPVSEPQVDAPVPEPGSAFVYTAILEVKPQVELPELAGLPGQRPVVELGDEDVEAELTSLRERRARFEDEPEGTAAGEGSFVTLDYLGRIDGEPFEGGAAQGASVEIGAGRMIPGFEEQLIGLAAGQEGTVDVGFPDDYQAEDVAGKQASFEVKVTQVRRRVLPELDDAFAKELDEELAGIDALREKLRADLTETKEREAKEALHRSLIDALIERTEFEVPPGMIERRLQQQLKRAHDQLAQAMPHEELHARLREWSESWRPEAEREVREHLLLEAIATQQEIEISDAELDEHLESLARDQGLAPERLRSAYEEQGVLEAVRAQMASDRALEILLAGAKVEEIPGT